MLPLFHGTKVQYRFWNRLDLRVLKKTVCDVTVVEVYCGEWGKKEKDLLQKTMLMYMIDEHMRW